MAGLFSKLIDFMEAEEWKYEIIEGETVLRFHFKGSAGRLLCYADVEEDKDWLIFYSYLPVNVPMDRLPQAAEFTTRANRGMRIGNFELDFNDGEVRYKTSIDVEGGELTHKMIDNLLRANLSTMNRYFKGLMELIYGSRSAAALIKEIEQPDEPPAPAEEPEMIEDEDEDEELDLEEDEDEDEDEDSNPPENPGGSPPRRF
jgi:hypothetical protein